MNNYEISKATQYLSKLKGSNLVSVGRASSLAWFLFAKDNNEYALHLQTSFRLINDKNILFTNDDIFEPSGTLASNKEFDLNNFDWDIQGNNRYDENVNLFIEKFSDELIVNDIGISKFGDLSIQLSKHVKLEVFVNIVKEENWRFFKRHSDEHLVITGEGIESDKE